MNIEITPDDVEKLVKDQLVKAGLGKAISEAVARNFSGYDNPVDKEIKKYVGEVVSSLIREKYAEQIKVAIATVVEERVTQSMIDETVDTAMSRIEKAANDTY